MNTLRTAMKNLIGYETWTVGTADGNGWLYYYDGEERYCIYCRGYGRRHYLTLREEYAMKHIIKVGEYVRPLDDVMGYDKKIVTYLIPNDAGISRICGIITNLVRAGYNVHRIYGDRGVVCIIGYIPVGDYVANVYRKSIGVMRLLQCQTDSVFDGEMWFVWCDRIISQIRQPIKNRRVIKELFGDYKVVEEIIGHTVTLAVDRGSSNQRGLKFIIIHNERG